MLLYIAPINAQQAGTADPTFNLADSSMSELRGSISKTAIVLANGKIVAGGFFNLIRFSENGYADKNFIQGRSNGSFYSIVEQTDGKLLVAGDFTTYNNYSANGLVRINSNGSIDNSFKKSNLIAGVIVSRFGLQNDGKIIVGGLYGLARLNTNGSLDTSFHNGGLVGSVNAIKIQTDGKIIIGGSITSYNNAPIGCIIRLNPNGSVDNSFTTGTGFDYYVNSIAIATSGKIIIGGMFNSYNGAAINRIARLQANGTLDPTFLVGTGFDNKVNTIVLEPAGKIIVGGNFASYDGVANSKIIRLNTSGSIDNTFSTGTGFSNNGGQDGVTSIARQQSGKIIVCGDFNSYNSFAIVGIVQLNSTGGIVNDFSISTGFNALVRAVVLQPDGKSIIGGEFTSYNGAPAPKITRLNLDGTIDNSFNPGTGFDGSVTNISLQNDGKIIAGGYFLSFDGNAISGISLIRLNTNGTLDTSFHPVSFSPYSSYITGANLVQSDGKILVGTDIGNFGTAASIGRLNANGSLDSSFTVNVSIPAQLGYVYCLKQQVDGKVLVGGNFNDFNGNAFGNIARLNADGSNDLSFITGSGFPFGGGVGVNSILIQTDGKILVGGSFASYAGVTANNIIRLNASGSRDLSFNAGSGFNSTVNSIAIQGDGHIIVGGDFYTFNATTSGGIIRLNADASIDQTFPIGTSFDYGVNALALQADDKVLVGGSFTTFNGKIRTRIQRLYSNSCPSDILVNTLDASCGANNGSVSLGAVTGGLAPYSYNVNNLGYSSTIQYNGVSEGGYDLLVKDNNGCEYTAPQITVLGSPTPYDVSVTTSNSACGNSNGSATIGFVSGGTFPYQYNFNGQGFSSNLNYSNLAAGSYALEVKDANNCLLTAPAVTVSNNDINYNVSFSSADTLLTASPFNAVFSNLTTDTVNNYFIWYFGDGSSYAGVTPPTHVYTINGNYTVTLLAINKSNGCTDTLTLPNYITCSGGPTGQCNHTVSINEASPILGCLGGTAALNCTSNASNPSYQWNINGVPIGGATQSSFTALFSGFYSVTVYNFGGCPITSSTVAVSFNNISPLRPTISQFGIIQPCSNDTVVLSVAPGFSSYLWSNGDTAHSIKVGAAGVYTVTGFNSNGCNAVSLPQNVSASPLQAPDICMVTVDTALIKNVIIWEKTPNLQIDSFIVFKESNVAGVFNRIGAQSYSTLSEFVDITSSPLIKSDRYRLAIKDTCGSLTLPGVIHKTMHLQITPGINLSRNLSWNPQEGVYFPSYEIWAGNPPLFPFSPIDTVPSSQNTYTDLNPVDGIDTKYLIQIVLPAGGCTSTARTMATKVRSGSNTAGNKSISIPDPLKVKEIMVDEISISPNPSNGIFTIQVNAAAAAQVFVFDILGNEILHKKVSKLNNQVLDLSGFANGFYECRIVGEQINITKKLVKN